MKYLILLLIVLGGIWWMRQQRRPNAPTKPRAGTQAMVPCTHCGTHVPEADAVPGKQGLYCSDAHRHSHEG
ncbi:MAG: hypothetical protein RLY41_772 [Pseudomonadota bacterium]|jgi:uncharacterized protein